jgi:hypothetical protein
MTLHQLAESPLFPSGNRLQKIIIRAALGQGTALIHATQR